MPGRRAPPGTACCRRSTGRAARSARTGRPRRTAATNGSSSPRSWQNSWMPSFRYACRTGRPSSAQPAACFGEPARVRLVGVRRPRRPNDRASTSSSRLLPPSWRSSATSRGRSPVSRSASSRNHLRHPPRVLGGQRRGKGHRAGRGDRLPPPARAAWAENISPPGQLALVSSTLSPPSGCGRASIRMRWTRPVPGERSRSRSAAIASGTATVRRSRSSRGSGRRRSGSAGGTRP